MLIDGKKKNFPRLKFFKDLKKKWTEKFRRKRWETTTKIKFSVEKIRKYQTEKRKKNNEKEMFSGKIDGNTIEEI